MKAVIQRVASAGLETFDVRREIHSGLVVLVGIEAGDTAEDRAWMAGKIAQLRVFEDESGKMNKAVGEVGGSILLVPNFTVAGDCRKGRRPSFDGAMVPSDAGPEFGRLADCVREQAPGVRVELGVFRAHMRVTLVNDGPVTLVLDSRSR